MEYICESLGLPDDSSINDVLVAIERLKQQVIDVIEERESLRKRVFQIRTNVEKAIEPSPGDIATHNEMLGI